MAEDTSAPPTEANPSEQTQAAQQGPNAATVARKATSQAVYSQRETSDARAAYTANRHLPYPHAHAVMRFSNTVVTAAFIIVCLCLVAVTINYIVVTRTMDSRPVYLKDEDGFTYRLRKQNPNERTKYVRDQIEEYVTLVLTGLYTYNPESQPQLDLMGNLVNPDIIDTMRTYYDSRKTQIFSKREIRTVSVTSVKTTMLDNERHLVTVNVSGSLIINSFRVSQAFPLEWDLTIEFHPEIKSGPNVYGMVLMRLNDNFQTPQQ